MLLKYGVITEEDSFNKKVATTYIEESIDLGLIIIKALKSNKQSVGKSIILI